MMVDNKNVGYGVYTYVDIFEDKQNGLATSLTTSRLCNTCLCWRNR